MVMQWMEDAGCERIFLVNNRTREGIDELIAYLLEDLEPLSKEEAKYKQALGIKDWEPLPDASAYAD